MILAMDLNWSVNITANYRQKNFVGNFVGFSRNGE